MYFKQLLKPSSAVGCPDPTPSENGWILRTGNRLHFGCNNSLNEVEGRRSHTIGGHVAFCNGTSWSKEIITCPAGYLYFIINLSSSNIINLVI